MSDYAVLPKTLLPQVPFSNVRRAFMPVRHSRADVTGRFRSERRDLTGGRRRFNADACDREASSSRCAALKRRWSSCPSYLSRDLAPDKTHLLSYPHPVASLLSSSLTIVPAPLLSNGQFLLVLDVGGCSFSTPEGRSSSPSGS